MFDQNCIGKLHNCIGILSNKSIFKCRLFGKRIFSGICPTVRRTNINTRPPRLVQILKFPENRWIFRSTLMYVASSLLGSTTRICQRNKSSRKQINQPKTCKFDQPRVRSGHREPVSCYIRTPREPACGGQALLCMLAYWDFPRCEDMIHRCDDKLS